MLQPEASVVAYCSWFMCTMMQPELSCSSPMHAVVEYDLCLLRQLLKQKQGQALLCS